MNINGGKPEGECERNRRGGGVFGYQGGSGTADRMRGLK